MTKLDRWRYGIAAVLILLLLGWFIARGLDGDPSQAVRRVRVPTAAERDSNSDGASTSEDTGSAAAASELARLSVRVGVLPVGSDLAWRAELYLEPTRSRDRTLVASESARGADTFEWELPADRLLLCIRSDDAVGQTWEEITLEAGTRVERGFELQEYGRLSGLVRGADGSPAAGARVMLVATGNRPMRDGLPRFLDPVGADPSSALSVETDRDGRYEIGGVDPRSSHDAAAAAPGHQVSREYGLRLAPGSEVEQNFALELGSRAVGRLLDAAGRPLAAAHLDLARASRQGDVHIAWRPEGESVTDGQGRFEFDCLEPGWKKIRTVLAAEAGISVVGQWELELERGDLLDLGDLLVRDSLFEAEIVSPEGGDSQPRVSFVFLAEDERRKAGSEPAIHVVPVSPDEDNVIRVRGLGPGVVRGTVRDRMPADEGLWRPASVFEETFDGGVAHVRWTLRPLEPGPPEAVGSDGRPTRQLAYDLSRVQGAAVALLYVNDELLSVQRVAARGGVEVSVADGDRVRLVATDGEHWGEHETIVDGDGSERPTIRMDRAGYALDVLVQDDGRAVARACVSIGSGTDGALGLVPFDFTGQDGRIRIGGLPPDTPLCVSASRAHKQTPPQPVTWVAGRAEVVIDVGD